MLSTAEANQHIWWTHVEHSPSITERCERSSFWFNVFSRPLFFLTLLELSLECNTMWWDITANSTYKICQKNHLSLSSSSVYLLSPFLQKSLALHHHMVRTAKFSLMYLRGHRRDGPFLHMERHQNTCKWEKNSCPILSPRTLFKSPWSSCKYLQSLAASWVTAPCAVRQTMFCRQYHFLDTLPDTHPRVRTSVHKGLRSKVHRDFII